MTSSEVTPKRKFFTTVAGDACLFAAALYALAMALTGGIQSVLGLTGPNGPVGVWGAVISGTGSLLGIAGLIVGSVIAWKLHGRGFGSTSIGGIVIGAVGGVIGVVIAAFAFTGIAMGVGAVTGTVPGLIAAVAVLAILFLIVVVRLDVDAVRDMNPERNEHRRLDVLRLASTGVLAVFTVGVIAAVSLQPTGEFGEAIPFVILAGAFAGLVTAIADAWVRREESKLIDTGAAISA